MRRRARTRVTNSISKRKIRKAGGLETSRYILARMRTSTLFGILLILVALLVGWYEIVLLPAAQPAATAQRTAVSYYCDEGVLRATYGSSTVAVTFPNGATLRMPQTVSGSGVRYEASSTVFWSKGEQAFVTVGNANAYTNCVAGEVKEANGSSTYTDLSNTFSVTYPSQFTLSGGAMGYTQSWNVNATTSGMLLANIDIPASYQSGTNFADSRFTVGASTDPSAVATCLTPLNGERLATSTVDLGGTTFSVLTLGGAGAGNFYDTTSYRAVHGGTCYAIEYTIHSLNIGNFPPERTVVEFDDANVRRMFEQIARSFRFSQ